MDIAYACLADGIQFRDTLSERMPFSAFRRTYLLTTLAGGDGHQAARKMYCKERKEIPDVILPLYGKPMGVGLHGVFGTRAYSRLTSERKLHLHHITPLRDRVVGNH